MSLKDHCSGLHAGSPSTPGHWTITTPDGPPFLVVRQPHPDTGDPIVDSTKWHGFAIDFWKHLSAWCEFNYTIKLPGQISADLKEYNFDLTNGSKSRGYGTANEDVYGGRTDMYMSAFYVTSARLKRGLMTQPIGNSPLRLVSLGAPDALATMNFLKPFSWKVWTTMMAMMLMAAIVTWFLETGVDSRDDFMDNKRADAASLSRNFGKSLWLSWSSFTGSAAHTPSTRAGMAFNATWTFFCILMVASYTATLAAELSQTGVAFKVESFKHMKSYNMRLCTKADTAYHKFLSGYDPLSGLQLVPVTGGVWGPGGMVQSMVQGRCDAMTDFGGFMNYATHLRCNASRDDEKDEDDVMQELVRAGQLLVPAPERATFGPQDNSIGLHENHTAALDDLNQQIERMRRTGIVAKLLDKSQLNDIDIGTAQVRRRRRWCLF